MLEAAVVIEAKKGAAGGRELDLLLHRLKVEIMTMDSAQTELARAAWRAYGKGRHPAGKKSTPSPKAVEWGIV